MSEINCNDLIRGLNPVCAAIKKVGGVDKTCYAAPKDRLTFTYDSDGYMNTVSISLNGSLPGKLYKLTGRDDKNSWSTPLTVGENINTFNHTANFLAYYSTPTEIDTIEKIIGVDKLVFFYQNNDGNIVVLGWDKGVKASAGEGGSGVLLNDTTAYSLTFSGENRGKEKIFRINSSATLAQNLAYLDNIASY